MSERSYRLRAEHAERRVEHLENQLHAILMQATRMNRASRLKRYLITDLQIIARKADKLLKENW